MSERTAILVGEWEIRLVGTRLLRGGVGVVESTEYRGPDDMARFDSTSMPADGRVAQGLMSTTFVIVIDEFAKDLPEVSFAEHDDVVEAFATE